MATLGAWSPLFEALRSSECVIRLADMRRQPSALLA